jgi:hypothetical protein
MIYLLMVLVCGPSRSGSIYCEWEHAAHFDSYGACVDVLSGHSSPVRLGEGFVAARCVQRNTEAK